VKNITEFLLHVKKCSSSVTKTSNLKCVDVTASKCTYNAYHKTLRIIIIMFVCNIRLLWGVKWNALDSDVTHVPSYMQHFHSGEVSISLKINGSWICSFTYGLTSYGHHELLEFIFHISMAHKYSIFFRISSSHSTCWPYIFKTKAYR
jgi:hypothetical protein